MAGSARPRLLPTPVPPLLQSIVNSLSKDSIHLLVNVVGTSTTWLTVRYLSERLGRPLASPGLKDGEAAKEGSTAVILVSWAQNYQLWRQETQRACAIDLNEAGEAGRFVYHDGLSTSALPPRIQQSSQPTKSAQYVHVLQSHDLNYTKSAILASRAAIPTDAEVLLILDSPDYLLGMLSCSASELLAFIMSLRQAVHSTVLTLQSDVFSQAMPAKSLSPLQTQQQQFLLSLAHQADRVLATRGLDSGSARDVSGVVRVTRGGRAEDDETAECPADVEWLYQVDMNRAARVWERGTDASGR